MPPPFISTRTMVGLKGGLQQVISPQATLTALSTEDLPAFALDTTRAYIPQLAQLRFFERSASDIGVGNLGFVLAAGADVRRYGLFGDYVTSAQTFLDALCLTRDMMVYHSSHDRMSLRRKGDILQLTYHSALRHAPGYYHFATIAASSMLSIAEPFFKRRYRRQIAFNFPRPRQTAPYETLFGCPVVFDQPEFSILFDLEAAQQTLCKKPTRRVTAGDVMRDAMGPAPYDLVGSVEAILRANISAAIGFDQVASQLDYSQRSLRRRLDESGTNFRDLARKLRIDYARELLVEGELDVTEISQHVGYSDPSHFGRAFRRLTGLSPSEARGLALAGNG
ncbi:MAG: AraC family transcriptional regulator ligand-binding domain-containing protein [Rhodobacteraceae bacterium]|nr:AraC family transcriptional regulator ligand-binding domain-containing protein [Paracoccaceae bacterium]